MPPRSECRSSVKTGSFFYPLPHCSLNFKHRIDWLLHFKKILSRADAFIRCISQGALSKNSADLHLVKRATVIIRSRNLIHRNDLSPMKMIYRTTTRKAKIVVKIKYCWNSFHFPINVTFRFVSFRFVSFRFGSFLLHFFFFPIFHDDPEKGYIQEKNQIDTIILFVIYRISNIALWLKIKYILITLPFCLSRDILRPREISNLDFKNKRSFKKYYLFLLRKEIRSEELRQEFRRFFDTRKI